MRDHREFVIALMLVAIITGFILYLFSWSITSVFGKETLAIAVVGFALFWFLLDVYKKLRKKKK